jgi:osmotically-inducible protein OsmY
MTGCAARQTNATPGDELLKSRVEAALAGAADLDDAAIAVQVHHGVVTITGRVASATEQQSVGAIVRAVPGVSDVRFSLNIEDQENPGGLP